MKKKYQAPKITITQYDKEDNEVGVYSGAFREVFDSIEDFHSYYYRVTALGKHEPQKRIKITHFGEQISNIGSHKLSEEGFVNNWLNYLVQNYYHYLCGKHAYDILFSFGHVYTHDSWYLNKVLTLKQNKKELFNKALDKYLVEHPMYRRIDSLGPIDGKPGIYMMVLDGYNACYIGQSNDMRKRIMTHWSRNNYYTGSGIDMFKGLDTTRIYVAETKPGEIRFINDSESDAVSRIPSRYTVNVMAGGSIKYLLSKHIPVTKEKSHEKGYLNISLLTKRRNRRMLNAQRFLLEGDHPQAEGWHMKSQRLKGYHRGRAGIKSWDEFFRHIDNIYGI